MKAKKVTSATTVQLGGEEWSIIWRDLSEEDYCGRCVHRRREIELDPGLTGARLVEVFIHECAHAVDGLFGLGMTEALTNTLGIGLSQMLAGVIDIAALEASKKGPKKRGK